jgi:segregation and condensation protein B
MPLPLGPAARRLWSQRPGNARPHAAARRAQQPPAPAAPADPLARDAKLARLEAALFLADEPLAAKKLAEAAGLADAAEARSLVARLRSLYDADGTAFQVADLAGGYQLLTRPAFEPWLVRLRRPAPGLRLTPTALETLAVIAYKQPVTRAEVDAVRGAACGEVIRVLMERGLVRVAGRHDSLGRPQLYATSKKFLQAFGLNALAELPAADGLPPPG